MKNRKAAMEMSVGTIVVIVLLMTVLILGLVLVRTIFKSSIDNIKDIDKAVKGEITKLFSEDSTRKIVIYPSSRDISLKKGEDPGGFGFSLRNVEEEDVKFTYSVSAVSTSCGIRLNEADDLIIAPSGGKGQITLASGDFMEDPVLIKFYITESTPVCKNIRYTVEVMKGSSIYGSSVEVDLEIKPE